MANKIISADNKCSLTVTFDYAYSKAYVTAIYSFIVPVSEFRFSLSSTMSLGSIAADKAVNCSVAKEWKPRWAFKSKEYVVSGGAPFSALTVTYHGGVEGWCNIIEERRTALSSYSAWCPFELSVPCESTYRLPNMEDYTIINARYDNAEKLWIYGSEGYDEGNIIALRNDGLYTESVGGFAFYYLNEAEKPFADCHSQSYGKIMDYYTAVFPPNPIKKMSIVPLDFPSGGGAYFRAGLMVIEKASEDHSTMCDDVICLHGHELGHNWFFNANTTTWEDWLNETGAEWALLLYLLHCGNNTLFAKKIEQVNQNYKDTETIKPAIGELRPYTGVHIRGVALLYKIYKRFGSETILTILQTLAELQYPATTDDLLPALRIKLGNDVPSIIQRGLSMTDYEEL